MANYLQWKEIVTASIQRLVSPVFWAFSLTNLGKAYIAGNHLTDLISRHPGILCSEWSHPVVLQCIETIRYSDWKKLKCIFGGLWFFLASEKREVGRLISEMCVCACACVRVFKFDSKISKFYQKRISSRVHRQKFHSSFASLKNESN